METPRPAAAAAEMPFPPSAAVPPAARIALLVACMAVIVAVQFPLLLSFLRGTAVVRSSLAAHAAAAQTAVSGERGRVLQALAAYSRYKQVATNGIARKRAVYAKLPSAHRSVGRSAALIRCAVRCG